MSTIAHVEPFVVSYREPNDHGSTRWVCLVRIRDGDGAAGWGEAVTMVAEAARATAQVVTGLADVLAGRPAADINAAWHAMKAHSWWYGEGGIASFAIAALDMALWDLAGQRLRRPLLALLGGPVHEGLPVVVTCHATRADLTEAAAEMAGWVRSASAIGIKVGFGKRGDAYLGYEPDRDVMFVTALRRALGPGPRLMVDAGSCHWSVADAVRRVRAFEAEDLYWIEEPLGADDPAGYATLRAKTGTLIAYGEREWTVRGIGTLLATGTVDVVGVDPGRAEGITGFARACVLTEQAGRQVNAHAFAGPLTYAASLALSLASPVCRQLEVTPFRNELYELAEVPAPVGGRVGALPGPGLGVTIDETVLRRLSRGARGLGGPATG